MYIILLFFSHSVVSNSLLPHGLQDTGVPCPSPSPSPQTNVSDAIQSSHPLSSPSPPTLSLFQLQGLFQ